MNNQTTPVKKFWTTKTILIAVVIGFIFCTYLSIVGPQTVKQKNQTIKSHKKIALGTVTDYTPGQGSGHYLYVFYSNGKKYSIQNQGGGDIDWRGKIGLTYPVIYDSLDPENYSELLIYPDEFKRFNINPDSLEKFGKLKWHREKSKTF
ncbi:MAG TPA: hypothetical protein VN922_17820 [Bacteroidia bacterium]|nr:hypothetical protein [Bacteroidia bacterium]